MIKKLTLVLLCLSMAGCAGGYVYGKKTKGRFEPVEKCREIAYALIPVQQQQEEEGIWILVEYLPEENLKNIFLDKKIYGTYAGKNPYPDGMIVMKVRIENKTESRIFINPGDFVLLDELGTQYLYISPERIKEIYEAKSSVYNFTKSTSSLAPGIYGAPLDMAKGLAGRGLKKKFALLKSIELSGGYLYPGVVYDGYLCFLKPNSKAKDVKLIMSNIKTSFDVNDEALGRIDFKFDFKHE
ncbi:MAG: hypothetical protein P9L98_04130 [Candidatus Kaelpia imicola]|nr:hypothetical protein [Candidatus Kaelpia imicola]